MMGNWSNIEFVNPWWFILLGLLPVYFFLRYWRNDVTGFSVGLPNVESEFFSFRHWKTRVFRAMPWLKSLVFILLIFAMARPQEKFQKQKISSEGIDIMLAIDLSLSMLAKDFEPDRLTVAKKVITDFIEDRPADRIGLAVFAGEGYTASPPTLDHKVLKQFIADLSYGLLKDGTAIGMGLSTSINRLKDSDAKSKIVILVTDGSNNAGVVDPLEAADMASTLGVKVYTIGVGTNGKALMPSTAFGKTSYRYYDVEIDEALLTEIAINTGGSYFRATNVTELEEIYDMINKLEKSSFDSTTLVRREDRFHPFLLGSLALCMGYYLLSISWFRNIDLT